MIAAVIICVIGALTVTLPLLFSGRVLMDVTELGRRGVDTLLSVPLWDSDSWDGLTAWGQRLGLLDANKTDARHMTLEYLELGHKWVVDNAPGYIVHVVSDDLLGGALNETQVQGLLEPVAAFFSDEVNTTVAEMPGECSIDPPEQASLIGTTASQIGTWLVYGAHTWCVHVFLLAAHGCTVGGRSDVVQHADLSSARSQWSGFMQEIWQLASTVTKLNASLVAGCARTVGATLTALVKTVLGVLLFLTSLW